MIQNRLSKKKNDSKQVFYTEMVVNQYQCVTSPKGNFFCSRLLFIMASFAAMFQIYASQNVKPQQLYDNNTNYNKDTIFIILNMISKPTHIGREGIILQIIIKPLVEKVQIQLHINAYRQRRVLRGKIDDLVDPWIKLLVHFINQWPMNDINLYLHIINTYFIRYNGISKQSLYIRTTNRYFEEIRRYEIETIAKEIKI